MRNVPFVGEKTPIRYINVRFVLNELAFLFVSQRQVIICASFGSVREKARDVFPPRATNKIKGDPPPRFLFYAGPMLLGRKKTEIMLISIEQNAPSFGFNYIWPGVTSLK